MEVQKMFRFSVIRYEEPRMIFTGNPRLSNLMKLWYVAQLVILIKSSPGPKDIPCAVFSRYSPFYMRDRRSHRAGRTVVRRYSCSSLPVHSGPSPLPHHPYPRLWLRLSRDFAHHHRAVPHAVLSRGLVMMGTALWALDSKLRARVARKWRRAEGDWK